MLDVDLNVLISPKQEDINAVLNPLLAHNATQVGASGKTEITVHAKNKSGSIIGGANGYTHWNYFFVAHLWVSDQGRGRGLGRQILRKIEAEAISRGCTHCWLDTFSFQAAAFYEKLDYVRFGELEDYPMGHKRFFYSKKLN